MHACMTFLVLSFFSCMQYSCACMTAQCKPARKTCNLILINCCIVVYPYNARTAACCDVLHISDMYTTACMYGACLSMTHMGYQILSVPVIEKSMCCRALVHARSKTPSPAVLRAVSCPASLPPPAPAPAVPAAAAVWQQHQTALACTALACPRACPDPWSQPAPAFVWQLPHSFPAT